MKKKKGLFFSLPSHGVNNTLSPFLDLIALEEYDIICYNTSEFSPEGHKEYRFIEYPKYFKGNYANKIDESTSYFEFGHILLDTSIDLVDFLISESEREKPDFILHSHLAVWGKLLAQYLRIPSFTLFSTFVLDKRIMLPFFRELESNEKKSLRKNVDDGLSFYLKRLKLYQLFHLKNKNIDIWDIYVNKGDLNVSFILPCFQPQIEIFGNEYEFVGFPRKLDVAHVSRNKEDLIYISMGTITSNTICFFKDCITAFKGFHGKCIISIGRAIDRKKLGMIPENIQVVQYANQQELLSKAKLFITHGGMASIHEAVYSQTPMIVIPVIPEQKLNARTVEDLGMGIHISLKSFSSKLLLKETIHILDHREHYVKNIKSHSEEILPKSPQVIALEAIDSFFARKKE
ncbi:MAG: glycosyltransferase [Allomuricauda sp.]